MDGPWPSILKQVVDDWNKNETVTFRIVAGGTGPQECRPVTGRVEACNWRYGTQEGWLGLTRLYFNDRGDHIQSATVQMNDSFFDTNSQYNNDAARRHTMCHELGHTPGLDHVSTNSCMNDSQFAVFNNLHPINKDFNQLARIYNHSDSTTTVAGQAKEGEEGQEEAKGLARRARRDRTETAGSLVRSPRASSRQRPHLRRRVGLTGSETMTVESTEEGGKVVTFITWAEEQATTSVQD